LDIAADVVALQIPLPVGLVPLGEGCKSLEDFIGRAQSPISTQTRHPETSMALKIQIHGHIEQEAGFDALVGVLARFYAFKVDYNGRIEKSPDLRASASAARNMLLDKNMQDEGLEIEFDYDPEGAVEALMACGTENGIDITVKRTWGSYGEDGYVSFVRSGGQPLKLPLSGGKVAINEDTMRMLRSREMCTIDTISRLFKVLDDARNLPRFTLHDDIVTAAVLPKRSLG
jgi:hypothetical protein